MGLCLGSFYPGREEARGLFGTCDVSQRCHTEGIVPTLGSLRCVALGSSRWSVWPPSSHGCKGIDFMILIVSFHGLRESISTKA
jgi:hypothetical protein